MKSLLLSISCLFVVSVYLTKGLQVIETENGYERGNWAKLEICPPNTKASGFQLNVQSRTLFGDDTAVNGIRLYCTNATTGEMYNITSGYETQGTWNSDHFCNSGNYLRNYALRVEDLMSPNATDSGDELGVTNMRFYCTNELFPLTGGGLLAGEWGEYSDNCLNAICGLQTRVQPFGGVLIDDSGLDNVIFLCC